MAPSKKSSFHFKTYISRVAKQVHADIGISGATYALLLNLIKITVKKLMNPMNQALMVTGAKTIQTSHVQAAVKIALPESLMRHALNEGSKAVTKYNANKDANIGSRAARASLMFNVSRLEKMMMENSLVSRKSATSSIYLTAVVEYVAAEILELSGNVARDGKRLRITPRHVMLAIRNDDDLDKFFKDTILGGGIVPYIHPEFTMKKTKKHSQASKSETQ